MEGYLDLRIAPWLRRLITRLLALVPAVLVISLTGEGSTQELLVLSQVILSLQLAFAVIPLIHFTSSPRHMGQFATPLWARTLAWLTAAIIVGLNGKLVLDKVSEWIAKAAQSSIHVGPLPLSWIVAAVLYAVVGLVVALLVWVTIKPWIKPSVDWVQKPDVELDWADALRPRPLATIGVAVEHSQADAEILNRALSLAQPGQTKLVLLHVADSPMTGVYGAETGDQHTESDSRYLAELVRVLDAKGYTARSLLLFGPDRAGKLVAQLKREPVDLLVVGSHGHGLVRDLLFGQTVDKVRHGLEIPMLIARPERATLSSHPAPHAEVPEA
jgi:manganese transport protein